MRFNSRLWLEARCGRHELQIRLSLDFSERYVIGL